jgi:hypothetical protein
MVCPYQVAKITAPYHTYSAASLESLTKDPIPPLAATAGHPMAPLTVLLPLNTSSVSQSPLTVTINLHMAQQKANILCCFP